MSQRSRVVTLGLAVLTVLLGLSTRRYGEVLPVLVVRYAGDVLWAALVFWVLAAVFPRAKTLTLAGGTVAVAFTVELSQLYHVPWLDALRGTTAGALILGQGFLISDLVCYVAGAVFAAFVDSAMVRARSDQVVRRVS